MIVWGGASPPYWFTYKTEFCDGARYDSAKNTWKYLSDQGAPSPRRSHTAVWTGKEMIVWGGSAQVDPNGDPNKVPAGGLQILGDGAAYNPVTDTWRRNSHKHAPSPRFGHFAVWTGSRMLIWGGKAVDVWGATAPGGGAYDPVADTWTPIADNLTSEPDILLQPANNFVGTGSSAVFSVAAAGVNPLNYQWFFETNVISGATSPTYKLTNAQPANSGSYTVVVSNSIGTTTSSPGMLLVVSNTPNNLPI